MRYQNKKQEMINRLIILILLFSVNLSAQSDIASMIQKGLDYSYNFKTHEAENTFQNIINSSPSDPRGYHYKSTIYLWAFLSNNDKNDLNKFLKLSDLAIEKSKNLLNENDKDETGLYITGASYGMRAMALLRSNSTMDAIWAAKKSIGFLNETLENYPKNYDAYLGKGVFSFALSKVPGVFKWALKIAGFSGNREEGINFLKQVYRYGKYSKTEAAYYLSQIYSESALNYHNAEGYLLQLIKKYPENTLFQYSYAVVQIKSYHPKDAEPALKRIIAQNHPKFQQVTAYSYLLLGDLNFFRNDYDKAITNYDKFVTTTHDVDYTGIANYRTALCYDLTGRRHEAQRYYILARNGNPDLSDDSFARRKSEIFFDRKMTENEINLLKAGNLIKVGRINEAYNALLQLSGQNMSEKLKAEVNLNLSDAAYELGKFEESFNYASRALSCNTYEEKWIKPLAGFYAARAAFKLGNRKKALAYAEKASSFSSYDYEPETKINLNSLKAIL